MTPSKIRPGDQPLPIKNDSKPIQELVIEDIKKRIEIGIERYGTPLQAFNGRDAMQDAYEEALDLTCYLKQCIIERDSIRLCMKCGYAGLDTLHTIPDTNQICPYNSILVNSNEQQD